MNSAAPRQPLLGLCLAGPTAAGKTAAALAFAHRCTQGHEHRQPVEIISVDSALVYRGLDIGTAKPSASERAAVPHHLIDIIDPTESYSAARFAVDARAAAAEIRSRGALPLLVGGTMLYFKALREGIDTMPAADRELRRSLDARAAVAGWPALHAELARLDPVTAARLAPADGQRIQRALEVVLATGRPISAWQRRVRGDAEPDPQAAPASWPLVALEPVSRTWLHRRIDERFAAMLAAGLVDELRGLRDRWPLDPALPSMRCVGYRQAWAALEGGDPATLHERGSAATRQLAKRQLTWLRSMAREVVACDADDATQRAVAALVRHAARGAAGADGLAAAAASRDAVRSVVPKPVPNADPPGP